MRYPRECSFSVALKALPLVLLLCSAIIISVYLVSQAYIENLYREKVCGAGICPRRDALASQPVCGSDGITYDDECSLVLASCSSKALHRAYNGECTLEEQGISAISGGKPVDNSEGQPLTCPRRCKWHGPAVCGTDGRTYKSPCHLHMVACKSTGQSSVNAGGRRRTTSRLLAVNYIGHCRDDEPSEETNTVGSQESEEDDSNHEQSGGQSDEEESVTWMITQPMPTATDSVTPFSIAPTDKTAPSTVSIFTQSTSDQSTDAYETPTAELSLTTTWNGAGATGRPTLRPVETTEIYVVDFDWSCPANGQCDSLPFQPICGSDGTTYSNLCTLRATACKTGDTVLAPVRNGNCIGTPGMEECFTCSDFFDPVCGTDKKSYLNVCQLKREACRSRTTQLKVSFAGLCEIPVRVCSTSRPCNPFSGPPVCGTDGVTYPSLCYLRRTACKRRDFTLVEVYTGDCITGRLTNVCQEHCPDIESAVCGTDGVTYRNYCSLQRAVCREPGLFHAYDGRCNRANQLAQGISALIP